MKRTGIISERDPGDRDLDLHSRSIRFSRSEFLVANQSAGPETFSSSSCSRAWFHRDADGREIHPGVCDPGLSGLSSSFSHSSL